MVQADSCEFPGAPEPERPTSLRLPFRPADFAWDGVTPAVYKSTTDLPAGMAWRDVVRHTLSLAGEGAQFQLRYFEIGPGGYSSLEKHRHVHSIVVLRGRGDVVVGTEAFSVAPYDIVHVPSATPHQFINAGDEPFGFLCPVDADRDPPQALTEQEIQALLAVPAIARVVRLGVRSW